jgi:hypothetical protein
MRCMPMRCINREIFDLSLSIPRRTPGPRRHLARVSECATAAVPPPRTLVGCGCGYQQASLPALLQGSSNPTFGRRPILIFDCRKWGLHGITLRLICSRWGTFEAIKSQKNFSIAFQDRQGMWKGEHVQGSPWPLRLS